jgi:hypothetical protein
MGNDPMGADSIGMDRRESMPAMTHSGKRPAVGPRCPGRARENFCGKEPERFSASGSRRAYLPSAAASPRGRARWIPTLLAVLSAAALFNVAPARADLHEPLEISDALGWPELIEQTVAN